jgi:hypothetical protein
MVQAVLVLVFTHNSQQHGVLNAQANTRGLMAAVSSLPELTERKRCIDKHTNLATRLLGEIKGRGLDQYYNTEEDLLTGQADLPAMEKLLRVSELSCFWQRLASHF